MLIKVPESFGNLNEDLKNSIYSTLSMDKIIDTNFEDIEWQNIKDKMQGVVIDDKQIVIFTPKLDIDQSKKVFRSKGRNTFLLQNFIGCYRYSIKNKIDRLSYSINFNNIQDVNNPKYDKSKLITKSLLFNLRELNTLNVNINKSLQLFLINKPLNKFSNLNEFLDDKSETKNSSVNKKTLRWSLDNEDNIFYVYSKNNGATRGELLTFLLLITNFLNDTKYKVKCVFLEENSSNDKDIEFFLGNKIELDNSNQNDVGSIEELSDTFEKTKPDSESCKTLKREQEIFKNNIVKQYFNEEDFEIDRCFCCNYIIGESLIRAHIHRFVDIKNEYIEKKLSKEEAISLNISGANGFLLCPNHDKMFERGEIIFDLNYLDNKTDKPFIVNQNNKNIQENKRVSEYIENSLEQHPKMFRSIVNDPIFISNVKKHCKRVNQKIN